MGRTPHRRPLRLRDLCPVERAHPCLCLLRCAILEGRHDPYELQTLLLPDGTPNRHPPRSDHTAEMARRYDSRVSSPARPVPPSPAGTSPLLICSTSALPPDDHLLARGPPVPGRGSRRGHLARRHRHRHPREEMGIVLAAERKVTSEVLEQDTSAEKLYILNECVVSIYTALPPPPRPPRPVAPLPTRRCSTSHSNMICAVAGMTADANILISYAPRSPSAPPPHLQRRHTRRAALVRRLWI